MSTIFQQNKYSKWYFNIIESRRQVQFNGYVEEHHIIPRSIGGLNESWNVVKLTAREHFICHLLLIKMIQAAKCLMGREVEC